MLFLTLLNSSVIIFLHKLLHYFQDVTNVLFTKLTLLLLHNFPFPTYLLHARAFELGCYDVYVSYNIEQLSVCTIGLCYLLPTDL